MNVKQVKNYLIGATPLQIKDLRKAITKLRANHSITEISTLKIDAEIKVNEILNLYAESTAYHIPIAFNVSCLATSHFKEMYNSKYQALLDSEISTTIVRKSLEDTYDFLATGNKQKIKQYFFINALIETIVAATKKTVTNVDTGEITEHYPFTNRLIELNFLANLLKICVQQTPADDKEVSPADNWHSIPRTKIENHLKQLVTNGYINDADFSKLTNNIFGADVELENKIEAKPKSHITALFYKMYFKAKFDYCINQLEWYNLIFRNFKEYKKANNLKEANNMFKNNKKVIWIDFEL